MFKALGIAGQGAVKGTRAVSDVTGFSTLAGRTGETIAASTQKVIDKYPVADQLLGLFRSRGMLPQQAFEQKAGLVGKVESQLNKTGIIVANSSPVRGSTKIAVASLPYLRLEPEL